jgi:hypothetical protein
MSACDRCWTEAWRRTYLKGGSVVEHYWRLLNENDPYHTDHEAES